MKPPETLDDCFSEWLAGGGSIETQKKMADGIEYLVLSRVRRQIVGEDVVVLVESVNESLFKSLQSGKMPSGCRISTVICRLADCRIKDILRKKYAKKRAPIVYVGSSKDMDCFAGENSQEDDDREI